MSEDYAPVPTPGLRVRASPLGELWTWEEEEAHQKAQTRKKRTGKQCRYCDTVIQDQSVVCWQHAPLWRKIRKQVHEQMVAYIQMEITGVPPETVIWEWEPFQ